MTQSTFEGKGLASQWGRFSAARKNMINIEHEHIAVNKGERFLFIGFQGLFSLLRWEMLLYCFQAFLSDEQLFVKSLFFVVRPVFFSSMLSELNSRVWIHIHFLAILRNWGRLGSCPLRISDWDGLLRSRWRGWRDRNPQSVMSRNTFLKTMTNIPIRWWCSFSPSPALGGYVQSQKQIQTSSRAFWQ